MSDIESFLWDFTGVPHFFTNWNVKYAISEMTSSNNFQFCFCDYASSNINDCLDGEVLSSDVNIILCVDCSLKWDEDAQTISVRNDTTWNIGDSIHPIKAVFLRKKSNTASQRYVLGYCIHVNSIEVTNMVKIPENTILWSIQNE